MSIASFVRAAGLVGLAGLMACSGTPEAVSPTGPAPGEPGAGQIPPGAVSVQVEPVEEATSTMSAILDRRRLVIRDAEAWAAFWDEFTGLVQPKPERPPVDFDTRMVIAATMGQKPSGGYVISIAEVAEEGDNTYALVRATSPGADCLRTTVLTAPAAAVSVPQMAEDVVFVEQAETASCGGS